MGATKESTSFEVSRNRRTVGGWATGG